MALVRASRAVIRSVCSGHSVGGTRGALARPVHCKVHARLRPCRARASSTLARSASVGAGTSNATAASSGDEAPNDDAWGTPEVVPGASVRVTPRATDYSAWYQDVIAAAEMVDHAPVRGCMVLRPHGYAVWESIKEQLDGMIKATGHVNAYFPLLIPQSFLSQEADHVEGFAKECAVVTHSRLRVKPGAGASGLEPDPGSKLAEPLVVRPTSEAIIWHMFGRWIQSHRDLPLLINQWANVVRWEMRTRPFLRTSEFLWQEGHTAHASREEALEEAERMRDVYATLCEEVLAMPVVRGTKSASERFAGADETLTIEAMMQNGWALQAGTSHFLGQNFAKAFNVQYTTPEGHREHVWATSWGVSTRLVGGLIMTHSDDTGLVLPPKVAPVQVVIVPITRKNKPEESASVHEIAQRVCRDLAAAGVTARVDDRDHMRPGAKYFEWERKGTPLRLELGPRDVKEGVVTMKLRIDDERQTTALDDSLVPTVKSALDGMQDTLLARARARLAENTHRGTSYAEMKAALARGADTEAPGIAGFFLVPWHDDAAAEAAVKTETKATLRCYPAAEQVGVEGATCFYSGRPATHMALFGRAY